MAEVRWEKCRRMPWLWPVTPQNWRFVKSWLRRLPKYERSGTLWAGCQCFSIQRFQSCQSVEKQRVERIEPQRLFLVPVAGVWWQGKGEQMIADCATQSRTFGLQKSSGEGRACQASKRTWRRSWRWRKQGAPLEWRTNRGPCKVCVLGTEP